LCGSIFVGTEILERFKDVNCVRFVASFAVVVFGVALPVLKVVLVVGTKATLPLAFQKGFIAVPVAAVGCMI
jgi:hypothetical protein